LKFGKRLITEGNQIQWIVLLTIAVALPTVSLLWFMSKAVTNEKMAVREKLAGLYQEKLTTAAKTAAENCQAKIRALDKIKIEGNPYEFFKAIVLEHNFEGAVVVNSKGIFYPASGNLISETSQQDNALADARQLEFRKHKYEEAAENYEKLSDDKDANTAIAAILGKTRCLSKLGRIDEAIEECQKAAFWKMENSDISIEAAIQNARLLLLDLLKQKGAKLNLQLAQRTVNELAKDLYSNSEMPSGRNLFIAEKILEISDQIREIKVEGGLTKETISKLAAGERLSISVSENSQLMRTLGDKIQDTFFRTGTGYGLCHRRDSEILLVLFSENGIKSALGSYEDTFKNSDSDYRIIDGMGSYIAGLPNPADRPFATAAMGGFFPGWKIELYFKGGEIFDKAANRQIAIYIWTGVLVILVILAIAVLAARAIGRQIRLNKMKNDFIATVSHELKTPLASMRVLVDTLLEGNIRDEKQSEEYLRLTAKENERLSRMIDNFLTFSRMERNKKAFEIVSANPAAIANDAAEAIRTKYASNNCQFAVDIGGNLPQIQADHDGMVTVIVNLLDNACKYSGEQKEIKLKVFGENSEVCFAVSDNGIGIAHRHIRRIFDRFYQVDSSLARKAEGCGLGLSIVKFIIDAHKGTISVDSKPGKGSTFTVRIPILENSD